MSCTEIPDNDPGCVEQRAESDPGCVKENDDNESISADNEPDCVTEATDNEPKCVIGGTDDDADCATEGADHDCDCVTLAGNDEPDCVPKGGNNEPDCITEGGGNEPDLVTKRADNEPDCVTEGNDNERDCVTEGNDNERDLVTKRADNEPDCVTEGNDNERDCVTEGNDNERDCVTEGNDNERDCVNEEGNNEHDCVTERADNEPDCVLEGAEDDSDCVTEIADDKPDCVTEGNDDDSDCVKERAESFKAEFFGTLIVVREKEECDMFAMCSSVMALGSARSNDIIVKNAAVHEIILQANTSGEVFLFHKETEFSKGRYLQHNEVFPVGRRLFRWKYPLTLDKSHGMSCTENDGNEPDCVTRGYDNEPDCITGGDDNEPDCVTGGDDNEPDCVTGGNDNEPDCVTGGNDNEPDCVTGGNDNEPDCVTGGDENEPDWVTGGDENEPDCVTEGDYNYTVCVTEENDNEPDCVTEGDYNEPDFVTEVADNEPDCVTEGDYNEPDFVTEVGDNGADCVTEGADNYLSCVTERNDNRTEQESIHDESEIDPYFSFDDSDEQYLSEEDRVSNSDDDSDVIPFVQSLPMLQNKRRLDDNSSGSKTKIMKKSVQSDIVTTSQKMHLDTLSDQSNDVKLQPSRNEVGKRIRDKLHYCVYCEESFTNLTKHLLGHHKNENEVVRISVMPKKSKKRADSLLKLRNAGDYKHNMDVLKNGNGTLITWSRKVEEEHSPSDYLPCEDCLGFFLKGGLWRHRKKCPFRKETSVNRRVQSAPSLLLPVSKKISAGLEENVVKKMLCDEVTMAVRNDRLILSVGEKLFQKHGHLEHLNTYISQKIRELGRLLISARLIDSEIQYLRDILVPVKFANVAIAATRALCKYDDNTNVYGNNKQILPLTEDIMKLQAYLKNLWSTNVATLQKDFSKSAYDILNQVTLARLVLFNRRRGGETQRVSLEAYASKCHKTSTPKEVEDSLSPVEKMLCATFSRIEIRGKKGRTVPVLLTPELESSIDLLLKHRESAGVHVENPYLFPRSNYASKQPLRSTDVLRKFSKEAHLSGPDNVTSTKLRKHVATVSQVLNLSRHDMETMAEFMGHDIDVHRAFYRLPQETIQVVKMGRLLSAFDNGTIAQYRGKSLDEIAVEKDMELSSEDDTDLETDCDDDDGEERFLTQDIVRAPDIQPCSSQTCSRMNVSEDSDDQKQGTSAEETGKRTKPVREKTRRKVQRLTEDQTKLLKVLFKTNVQLRKELRRADCEKVLNKHSVLRNLDWKKVKNTIHNWITAEKRKMKQI
ncbi:hypothetical protein ACF0H5_011086 [Mactra antiquata]